MGHAHRIWKGAGVVFLLSIIGTIAGYLLRLFLAHNLSVEQYGMFYAGVAFVGIFALFRDLGLNVALAKFIPEFIVKKELWKIKSLIAMIAIAQFAITFAVMGAIIIFSDAIALGVIGTIDASIVLKFMALSTIVSVFFHIFQSVFQGFQKPLLFSSMNPLRTIFVLVAAVFLIGMGVSGVAIAYVLAAGLVVLLYLLPFIKLPIAKGGKIFSKPLIKKIVYFAVPVFFGSLVGIAMHDISTILLTFLAGTYFTGLYQVALPTSQLLYVFVGSITAVALPAFSELWARNEKETMGFGIGYIIVVLCLLIMPLILAVFALSDNIIIILFGGSYFGAINILRILMGGAFFYSMFSIFNMTLSAIGKTFVSAKILTAMAVMTIALSLILVPLFQGIGTAIAVATAFLTGSVISFYSLEKYFKIRILYGKISRIIISSLIMLGAIFAFKEIIVMQSALLEAVLSAVIGLIVYVVFVVYTKAVNKNDIEQLRNMGIKLPFEYVLKKILR